MKIQTQLTFKSYLRFVLYINYTKFIVILFSTLGLLSFIGTILYISGHRELFTGPPLFLYIMFFLAIFTLIFPLIFFWSSKRFYDSSPKLREKVTYEFDEEKIKIYSGSGSSEINWDSIYQVIEN